MVAEKSAIAAIGPTWLKRVPMVLRFTTNDLWMCDSVVNFEGTVNFTSFSTTSRGASGPRRGLAGDARTEGRPPGLRILQSIFGNRVV